MLLFKNEMKDHLKCSAKIFPQIKQFTNGPNEEKVTINLKTTLIKNSRPRSYVLGFSEVMEI